MMKFIYEFMKFMLYHLYIPKIIPVLLVCYSSNILLDLIVGIYLGFFEGVRFNDWSVNS